MSSWLARLLTLLLVFSSPMRGEAHPQGMSSINRYVGVRLHTREVEVDYLVDFAEIPAWTEIETLDGDHDGAVTQAERDRYVASLAARITPSLEVRVEGTRLALRVAGHGIEAPAGQRGLSTLRVAIEFRGALPDTVGAQCHVRVRDTWMNDRSGWRELGSEDTAAGRVLRSTIPAGVRAGAALAYPTTPGASTVPPPRIDDATFVFDRAGSLNAPWTTRLRHWARGDAPGDNEGARLVALIRSPTRSPGFVLFALILAFALGAGHAIAPGHGKAMVGAWLVGARGGVRHALLLGVTVTVTHTASVFLLGLFALTIERHVGSEKLLRMLELISGVMVAGVALSQLPSRWRRLRGLAEQAALDDHGHDHRHEHSHDHGHDHDHAETLSLRGLIALGVSGGIVPCTGALVLLLTAIGLGHMAFGMALLTAFSLGLASVLSGIGVMFVLARARFERMSSDGRLFRVLPVLSSCAVLALGLWMVLRALVAR